jgi:hypothetical protein
VNVDAERRFMTATTPLFGIPTCRTVLLQTAPDPYAVRLTWREDVAAVVVMVLPLPELLALQWARLGVK